MSTGAQIDHVTQTGDEHAWWYSTAQASQVLGVSRRVVHTMIEQGELPAYRATPKGNWRIRRQAVDRLAGIWRPEAS